MSEECNFSRVDTTSGNRKKEDDHLERDHWGKQEMLKLEKLPKSSALPGNDVRGEAKHAKESL